MKEKITHLLSQAVNFVHVKYRGDLFFFVIVQFPDDGVAIQLLQEPAMSHEGKRFSSG